MLYSEWCFFSEIVTLHIYNFVYIYIFTYAYLCVFILHNAVHMFFFCCLFIYVSSVSFPTHALTRRTCMNMWYIRRFTKCFMLGKGYRDGHRASEFCAKTQLWGRMMVLFMVESDTQDDHDMINMIRLVKCDPKVGSMMIPCHVRRASNSCSLIGA